MYFEVEPKSFLYGLYLWEKKEKRIKDDSKHWACVTIKMGSPSMKTRKSVIDSNKPKMHVVIYMESAKGKARKYIANKLVDAKIK